MIDEKIESILKKVTEEIKNARDDYELDNIHNLKRVGSFLLMDLFMERCCNNECPPFDDNALYLLSDISVEEYFDIKKYHLGQENKGSGDKERRKICSDRIDRVLNCNKKPELDLNIFEKDINVHASDYKLSDSIKNRKAYWSFEKYKPHNNPRTDYEAADGLVKKINKTYHNIRSDAEMNNLKNHLKDHFHIVNGFDLFKLCAIKQKFL